MDNKRNEMINIINEYKNKSKEDGNYYLIASDNVNKLFLDKNRDIDNLYYIFELYKEWDDYGSIPYEVGVFFEKLISDKSNVVGVHRSDSVGKDDDIINDEILKNIFTNGLINNGDLFSSGRYEDGYIDPSKTLSPCSSMLEFVMLVKTGRKYGDKASIITCIPSEYVNEDLDIINDSGSKIYIEENGFKYIDPKYIAGCITQDNGNCKFYLKSDILEPKKSI